MPTDRLPVCPRTTADSDAEYPAIVERAGGNAKFAYAEFFAGIDSPHTRRAYRRAVDRFLTHCERLEVPLFSVSPALVSAYIRTLPRVSRGRITVLDDEPLSKPTRKLHLAAIRHFFDKAVERHAVILNPAASVRGPRHSVTEGKTPVISTPQARALLMSIDTSTTLGLRDRAVIATLIYTAARVGAVAKLNFCDFYGEGRQHFFRLDEKGGKQRSIPCRADLQGYVEAYVQALVMAPPSSALFRTIRGRGGVLTDRRMSANDMLRMVKRRMRLTGLAVSQLCCHSFRAGTATDLLEQGINPAEVQFLLGHADPRTTQLYDRRQLAVSRNIVERISV